MDKNRVWIYCRTARKNETAIEMQKRWLKTYAAEQGFSIVGGSSDQQSGLTLERPGLLEVNKAVNDIRIDILLVANFSRIARSTKHILPYYEFLDRHEVRISSPNWNEVDMIPKLKLCMRSIMESYNQ